MEHNRPFEVHKSLGLGILMVMLAGTGVSVPQRAAAEKATAAPVQEGNERTARQAWLSDPYPAQWLDSADLLASRFGEVKFAARDGNRLSAFLYRGTAFNPVDGPIWFVLHGAGRSAKAYLTAAAPIAERHNALAIVIEFPERTYPDEDYTLGVTTYGRVNEHAHAQGRWRQPDAYLYSEIEHVFEAIRELIGGRQHGYYLFGHSAGAQFVHRLVTLLPKARVLRAVAANAGWYTLPTSAAVHAAMPYGLRGTPIEHLDPQWLYATPLTVMLGAHDTATPDEDPLLRGTVKAMAQGRTRLDRGLNYFAAGRTAAQAGGTPFAWHLAIVPRAEHEVTEVIGSAEFFLFGAGAGQSPCEATPAAAAGGLVINEVLVDPPDGERGDANADGSRDASDDEFVEIVNTGTTPICLAGWTLGDASNAERHVFPLGEALAPGAALVIFGGGVPTGPFGDADVQWAAFDGRLSLSNTGDVLTLRDSAGTIVKQVSWGDCAGEPCALSHRTGVLGSAGSLVRWPELVGEWTLHGSVSSSGFSPGERLDGSPF